MHPDHQAAAGCLLRARGVLAPFEQASDAEFERDVLASGCRYFVFLTHRSKTFPKVTCHLHRLRQKFIVRRVVESPAPGATLVLGELKLDAGP